MEPLLAGIKHKIFKSLDQETKLYKYECDIYFGGENADRIYYGKPIIFDETREHYMYPNEARLRNMTYGFTIHYDVVMKIRILMDKGDGTRGMDKFIVHKETLEFEKVYLGKFPIMIGSDLCILKNFQLCYNQICAYSKDYLQKLDLIWGNVEMILEDILL